jgi:hypothetical protein
MRGVTIIGTRDGRAGWVRFYMEPVEMEGPDADAAVRQIMASDRSEVGRLPDAGALSPVR